MKLNLQILYLLIFLTNYPAAFAQDKPGYAAMLIPDSMKKNALSVIRDESLEVNITGPGKGEIKTRKVITILSEKGEHLLLFNDYEDRFRSLDFAEVRLYDARGNYIKRYKKKEMEKVMPGGAGTLVSDVKVYYFPIGGASGYPVTAEFVSEISFSGLLRLPEIPVQRAEQSVMKAVYSYNTTPDNPVRYKNYHCSLQPVVQDNGRGKTFTWTVLNSPALVPEPGSADDESALPFVAVTPTLFEMDNYPGTYSNWNSFGRWYYDMSQGANELTGDNKTHIISLLNGATGEKDKIRILYKYLQDNFRYVSIQLGIGGFKPFPAAYVEKNKYGDCKALSNYMQTILQVAGIKSYQALINAGSDAIPADPDFASNPFNHVILCVPQGKDTVWLECTSQETPFGRLGSFTENRYALLITENGGVLAATPQSRPGDNLINTTNRVKLNEDGSGVAIATLYHSGEEHDRVKRLLWNRDETGRKENLIQRYGFKQFDDFGLEKMETPGNHATRVEMSYEKVYDFNAGSKYFLRPHLHNVWSRPLPNTDKRTTDYYFDHPFSETDSTVYELPANFTMESMPKPVKLQFSLGSFETRYNYNATARTLTASCTLVVHKHRIPAADYQAAKTFFDGVIQECEQKIVVKRN